MEQRWEFLDGNEAAARVAYAPERSDPDLPDHTRVTHGEYARPEYGDPARVALPLAVRGYDHDP
jgi:hypothetical protein